MNRPEYGSDSPNQSWLNLTRNGIVYDRQFGANNRPEVKVYYPDRDILSDWLPVKQQGSAGAMFHYCPRIGDAVTVENLGTGIEQGVVTGAHPTDNNPVVQPNSLDSVALATDDGAFFEHEPNSKTLTVAGVGTMHLSVNGETLAFSGTWTLNASGACSITANSVTIKAGAIKLDGPVEITQTLKVDGYTTLAGGGNAIPNITNSSGSGGGS
jgi:phage baseplate assembly protein V